MNVANPMVLSWLMQLTHLALERALLKAGKSIAARIAMMAMTTVTFHLYIRIFCQKPLILCPHSSVIARFRPPAKAQDLFP
jgi:ribosomal protein L16/L10AE